MISANRFTTVKTALLGLHHHRLRCEAHFSSRQTETFPSGKTTRCETKRVPSESNRQGIPRKKRSVEESRFIISSPAALSIEVFSFFIDFSRFRLGTGPHPARHGNVEPFAAVPHGRATLGPHRSRKTGIRTPKRRRKQYRSCNPSRIRNVRR